MIRKSIFVIGFITSICTLFAGGFALTGVGSRATSMGGAVRGMADDGSAMYWNPAGLGFLDYNSYDLGATLIMPSSHWENSGTLTTGGTVIAGYEHKKYNSKNILRGFPSASLVMAKNPKYKFGLGIFVPYGLGATWDAYQLPQIPSLHYVSGFPKEELMSSLVIADIHPSFAYQINQDLSAGLGLSVFYSTIQLKTIDFKPNASAPTDQTYQYAPITTNLQGNGMGIGFNAGLLYKATDQISLGISGKTPSKISLDGDAEVFLWRPDSLKIGGKSDISADLNLPGDIGFGISYKIQPNWAVNLDYAYSMWKTLETVKVKMDEPVPMLDITESQIKFYWEDTHRISMGTEYKTDQNAYRCGFFWDQSPIPEHTFSPTFPDINDKISSNIGFGHSYGNWTLDMNLQYIIFSERDIKTQNFTNNNKNGVYKANSISGNIGITYKM